MTSIKKFIASKKFIYILCFIALNFIDVIRDVQFVALQVQNRFYYLDNFFPGYKTGDIWMIIANCTGILMMIIIFSAYDLRKFFTISNAVWTAVCVALMCVIPFVRTGEYGTILIQEELAVFNLWWIGILVKRYVCEAVKEKTVKIKFSVVNVLWIAMTILMVTSVARAKIWPLWYFFMFGLFYITEYKKEDISALFDAMMDGSIMAFLIMQIATFFLRPYDDLRYQGIHFNWNLSALYYLIIFTMCLCKFHVLEMHRGKRKFKIYYLCIAGVALSLEFMTGCRTAWIVTALLVFCYGIFIVRKFWNITWKQIIARFVLLMMSMAITFVPVFMMARWFPTVFPVRVWYSGELDNAITAEDGSIVTGDYTELNEFLGNTFSRIFGVKIATDEEISDVKSEATEVEVQPPVRIESPKITEAKIPSWIKDPAMQQRFRVYSAYFYDMTWIGNGPDAELARGAYHSHNVWLQMGYFYGIPSGILLIVLMFALIVRNFRKMKKFGNNPYVIVSIIFTGLYFVFGMTEVVWNTGQLILFLIFFVQYGQGDEAAG